MDLIIAVIQPSKLDDVKEALVKGELRLADSIIYSIILILIPSLITSWPLSLQFSSPPFTSFQFSLPILIT